MKNTVYLIALVLSLGCILFLYQKLTATEEALHQAEQKFTDCQQVTFQLQNQLNQATRSAQSKSGQATQ